MLTNSHKKHAAITICSSNYLSKALVLQDTYTKHHPDSDFFILIVDRKDPELVNSHPNVSFMWVEELEINEFYSYAFKFDVIELNTNVKPTALKKLLQEYKNVLYLDPDIKIYSYLKPVFEGLASNSIVVTPHTFTPVLDGKNPSDVDFLRFGAYNLGFVGVSKCDEAFNFLDWWSDRCLKLGFYEPQNGLAVDQGWVDLAPSLFPNLKILRDVGLNVAFWNLHERAISQKNGVWHVNEDYPLYFFHFSSFSLDKPHAIAHKQSRFAPGSRPDLHHLLDEYADLLKKNDNDTYSSKDYSFDYFDDGTYISPTLRRFFDVLEEEFPPGENPFSTNNAVYRFAIKRRLAKKGYRPARRYTFRDMGKFSAAIKVINHGLYLLLMLVGPNRYFSLMRFLSYISSIRNQKGVIRYTDR